MHVATKTKMQEAFTDIQAAVDTMARAWERVHEAHKEARNPADLRGGPDFPVNNAAPLDKLAGHVAMYMRHRGLGEILQNDYGPSNENTTDLVAAVQRRIRGL